MGKAPRAEALFEQGDHAWAALHHKNLKIIEILQDYRRFVP
ncbi:hypothetical protein [Magnetococcus marinus]|nr:hypothetical protein [Magnetococcus marinus]